MTRRAFTLIELALIVVVVGVLAAAAVPRLQQTAQRMRVEQAAFEFVQLLRLAHARAVSEGQAMVWSWDPEARRARVAPSDPEADPASSPTLESAVLPEGFTVDVTRDEEPVSCGCITFFPQGTAEATALTVQFDTHAYTVTVDASTSHALIAEGNPAR